MRKNLIILVSFLLITGCSFFIGKLPEPDPIFKAADGYGAYDQKTGCLVAEAQRLNCSSADERIKKYLSTFLPLPSSKFVNALAKQGFQCHQHEENWNCFYVKSQAPAACATAVRVSVNVIFPVDTAVITVKNIDVKSSSIPDPENQDQRGCLPL